MKKLALLLALVLLVLPLGGCKNLEAGLFYDRMNEHRDTLFSEEISKDGYWTITGDDYFFERVAESTWSYVYYDDHYEYRAEVNVVDDGEPDSYVSHMDGTYSYTHFRGNNEKMKVRMVDMDELIRRIEQKYSDDAISRVYVTQLEDGKKKLTVEFDLTLVEAELVEKARESALQMARFDSQIRYTWAKVEYLVDADYRLLEDWYYELCDITEADGTVLKSDYMHHNVYLFQNKTQRIRMPADLEDYYERL